MDSLQELAHNPVLYVACGVFLSIFLARAAWAGVNSLPRFVNFLFSTLVWTLGALLGLVGVVGVAAGLERWQPGTVPPPSTWSDWAAGVAQRYFR